MIRYLLDTNALVEFLLHEDSARAGRMGMDAREEIAFAVICLHALYYGAFKGQQTERNLTAIESLKLRITPFEAPDTCLQLQRLGLAIGPYDVLIAGRRWRRGWCW